MAHRDRSPVHVPLRTSSRNLLRPGAMESQEDASFVERKSSKAQRILGTDLLLPNAQGGWDGAQQKQKPKSRRQSLRTPDSSSRSRQQHTSFAAFPKSEDTIQVPPQNLRVRASSPLLGQDYRSQDPAPPLPKPSKKIHASGSSSTLFSYFSSKEKETKTSKSTPTTPKGLQPRVRNEWQAEPQVTFQQPPPRSAPKESKRKLRPPRIDLSILFPKPRHPTPNPHLLSPQRVTDSPSPVSTVASDWPSNKIDRIGSNPAARRFGEPLPPRTSIIQNEAPKQPADRPERDRSDLLSIPESKNDEWYDHPLERTVGTSEIDLALDRYAGRRSLFSRSSVYTASREQLRTDQRNADTGTNARCGHSPSSNRRKDSYLAPSQPEPARPRKTSSAAESNSRSVKSSMTKKSSKSTLKNKDLQNSSVLCLSSSSEDEAEEDQETPTELRPNNKKPFRDSDATYGEFDAEIYTASTAQAATAQMLKRVDRAPSTSSHGSHKITQKQSNRPDQPSQPSQKNRSRHASTSTSGNATVKSAQSRRSSGAPALPQQDILDKFPQQRLRTPRELKEMNRRSRVIAVTRQEQDLLEAMRQRKGKATPSLFQYNANGASTNGASEVDRNSTISGPSRDSFCMSDTSFLRLSAAFPLFQPDPNKKTGNSIVSPRFSMAYSESLPSPATSGASPLTPTLPIHRFSPLPSPKPPPRGPPPAIPDEQKRHSRRRTDSSEAIMLNDNGDPQSKHDLPLWSFDFDWNNDRTNVAAVH
ncbi:hypothetical protein N7532_011987 [Penicillium argentinense]|uniref:Uncharacterized protein n=1 Tax=Penicillium argentinense TaxID=1131581 RepID=A0A9W9EJM2_9EURO|nr:uncharacterized protein N7532_011987 [Penicillium argentinense]KAJ5082944.1 hypothetical protein N7532_011987 [Penicillium argentinense]